MKIYLFYLLVLGSFSCVSISNAANCSDLDTQKEINRCAEKEYLKADKLLNKTYRETQSRIDKTSNLKLKKVQLVWLEYRDAHCSAAIEGYLGGSMEPLIRFECLRLLTEQRIEALESSYPKGLP